MKYLVLIFWISLWQLPAQKVPKKNAFDDYFYDAMTERLKNNYQQSNQLFEQCLSIDPDNDVIYFKIAQNYFDLKDYDQSLVYLRQAQKYNPNNKWYQKLFIEIKIKQQTDPKALYQLIHDFEAKAHNKYLIQDLYRQVQRNRLRVQTQPKLKPKEAENNIELQNLYNQKKYQKLIEKGEKALEQRPDDANIYLHMAKAYTGLKQYHDAIDYLDMGMDFVIGNKEMLKAYYQQYIAIFSALKQTGKAKLYQQKLEKL